MRHETIGFALCGSFCTLSRVFTALEKLRKSYEHIIPIVSEAVAQTDTRFGTAKENLQQLAAICEAPVLSMKTQVEPFGPKKALDALIIAPCTGNTLAKLANGISDSTVTLAAKAHLRNERPLILAISSNDALSGNADNLGRLLNRKNVYFVPFCQDSPETKPASLMADFSAIGATLDAALQGRQLQPMLCAR